MEENISNKGNECCAPGVCPCMHHKIMPILIVLVGLDFLLGSLGAFNSAIVNMIWPVLVILMGLAKLSGGMCKCYHKHY